MIPIIASPDDLSPARLTDILNHRFGGTQAHVAAVRYAPIGFGLLSDSMRFTIDYDGARPANWPDSLVGKFAPSDEAIRTNGAQLGVYSSEVGFYREIAATVAVRRPDCLYAEIATSGREFGIIMEDLGPARAGDQLGGCSIEDARLVAGQAAALHGPRWNDPSAIKPWMLFQQQFIRAVLGAFDGIVATFIRRLGPGLSEAEIATIERFGREAVAFYNYEPSNRTIVHSDLRLDNILFEARAGEVPVAILDWQSIVPGSGALDIGFFLCTSLTPETRRANERELLTVYHDALTAHGVRNYSAEMLWQDYRCAAYQALFTAISASYSARQTERADQLFTRMARGGVALMQDLGSFEAVAAAG